MSYNLTMKFFRLMVKVLKGVHSFCFSLDSSWQGRQKHFWQSWLWMYSSSLSFSHYNLKSTMSFKFSSVPLEELCTSLITKTHNFWTSCSPWLQRLMLEPWSWMICHNMSLTLHCQRTNYQRKLVFDISKSRTSNIVLFHI